MCGVLSIEPAMPRVLLARDLFVPWFHGDLCRIRVPSLQYATYAVHPR